MDNRSNTIAGWVLAACVTALGVTIASGMVFHDSRPEKMGYPIEGVEAEAGAGGAAAAVPIATLLASADVAKGAEVFKKCASCHTVAQGGANGIGPNLWGTLGKPIAGHAGFAYSDALKGKGGTWTFEAMDAWLKGPRKFAEGTKMSFAGLGSGEDRANVIAYLNSNGSNLPLPAAPAAGAAPAAPGGEDQAVDGSEPANVAVDAQPPSGSPAVDPAAAEQAKDKGSLPKTDD
jgi:cytochrome c